MFDTFKKRVFFEQVKWKVQFIYLTACIYWQKCIHEVKLKIEDAVNRQFTMMHRDIEFNWIDDMIIVIELNRKISVGSHP